MADQPSDLYVDPVNVSADSLLADKVTKDKRNERLAEMGAAAAGAYGLYEKHEGKKDPENAHRHNIEEELAGVAGVGAGGGALYEHHEGKKAKEGMGN